MPTRRLSGTATAASAPDNGGDHSGGGGSAGGYVDDVFSTYVYTGDNTVRDIENGIDLAGEGGMVWLKNRTGNFSHNIYDTERGPLNYLMSNDSAEENISPNGLSSFNSNGFTHGIHMGTDDVASWTFRKAPKFFDVVTYTGTGTEPSQWIEHNLGCVPGCIIIKRTDSTGDWYVYHSDLSDRYGNLYLNNSSQEAVSYVFDKTSNGITDTQFRVFFGGNNLANIDGAEYVAYLFAHDDSDESIIKCGSYRGNGSNDGPEIDLGFEPQFVLIKATSMTSDWEVLDAMRGITTGGEDAYIRLNQPYNEGEQTAMSLTPTGFVLNTNWNDVNFSGVDYIYMAIRRPNKPAEEFDPEELFGIDTFKGTTTLPNYNSGFATDMAFARVVNSAQNWNWGARLTGTGLLKSDSTAAELTDSGKAWDFMDGYNKSTSSANSNNYAWMFRRAPGFFDVVCYEGDGTGSSTGRDINHNLGVVPDLMIIKKRNNTREWRVGGPSVNFSFGDSEYNGTLNSDIAFKEGNAGTSIVGGIFYYYRIPTIGHTATTFRVGYHSDVNASGDSYIAYLFASVPGISKVGSYTGTGNALLIDCGFTTGARFLLIKRTDGSGGWFVWDSARGMTGNPPMNYLRLDSTINEQPGRWFVTVSEGFQLRAMDSYKTEINVSGQEYIFYAIAE